MDLKVEENQSKKRGRPVKLDEKRNLILNTAKQCFMEKGYDLTTLDHIAQKIGFNKSAFYYYFKDKDALFLETIKDELEYAFDDVNPDIPHEYTFEYLYNHIKRRTETALKICKIHKLKRSDALEVTLSYKKLHRHLIINEIDFLKQFIKHNNPSKFNNDQLEFYSNLLYQTLFSFTNTDLLVYHIHNDNELSSKHIEKKIKLAELFLKGLEKI